jgi:hypothetical protein
MVSDEFFSPIVEPPPRSPRPWIMLILVLGVVVAGYGVSRIVGRASSTSAVTASSGRLTLEKDDGGNITAVSRRERPELWFRVTLAGAPVGSKLTLTCDWVDPTANLAHRNRYKTRAIDRPSWPTHARFRVGPGSPTGTWTVRLSLDGRVLRTTTFEVRD